MQAGVLTGGDWLRVALGGAAQPELFQAAILDNVVMDLWAIRVLALVVSLARFLSWEA